MNNMSLGNADDLRDIIDLIVGETGYPVSGSLLTEMEYADNDFLRRMENKGLIKSVIVEVPSKLAPGKTVHRKAYYTERNIPAYVEEVRGRRTAPRN